MKLSRHTSKCAAAHSLGNPATKPSWLTATKSSAGWIAANRVALLPLPPDKKQNVRCMTRRIGQKKAARYFYARGILCSSFAKISNFR